MASYLDRLATMPGADAQLYDVGEINPRHVGLLLSNIRGLGTERVVSDFSAGWISAFDPGLLNLTIESLPGRLLLQNGRYYLIVKSDRLPFSTQAPTPVKVQLQHMAYAVTRWRNNVMSPYPVRLINEVSITLKSETEEPLDRISIITPAGTDLRVNDVIAWDGWYWMLRDVTPGTFDGHEFARRADILRLSYVAAPQDYVYTNAMLLRYRGDLSDPFPVPLRARWFRPTHESLSAQGPITPSVAYFARDADVTEGDILMQVKLDDGDPHGLGIPLDSNLYWVVRRVDHSAVPLALLHAELEGGRFNG